MGKTKIEWCDVVWNPVTGCTPVSEGCRNCYAARMAKRLRGRCGYPEDDPFQVTFHKERLSEPARWRKPCRVFVGSMGDMGHRDVVPQWREEVARFMRANNQHIYMILTKRPGDWMRVFAPYAWLGVTAENQARAEERIPILLSIPAAVHFISVEPMLGPVDLISWLLGGKAESYAPAGPACAKGSSAGRQARRGQEGAPTLDWVIAGPENGTGARECKPEWIEDLWNQCNAAGAPFFDKCKNNWIEREWPGVEGIPAMI